MSVITLDQMQPGQIGRIARVRGEVAICRRLREMGVVPGVRVRVVRSAPLGGPIDVELMGYHLSLRRSEAAHVRVHAAESGTGVVLSDAEIGHDYQIVGLAGGRGMREQLAGIGVREGAHVTLLEKGTEDGPVTLYVDGSPVALGSRMAHRVRVTKCNGNRPDGEAGMIRVALAGNPNSGKTTVFNNLTGTAQRVGNYPGVTVEKKVGITTFEGRRIEVTDLPGNYSLTPYSPEERVARQLLLSRGADVVVDVVDASNLERNLYLATQLMELGVPLVLAFNMSDLAQGRGRRIDYEQLSALFGVPIVPLVASRNRGTRELFETIVKVAEGELISRPRLVGYGADVDAELDTIERWLVEHHVADPVCPPRWLALKLLEGDEEIGRLCGLGRSDGQSLGELVKTSARHLRTVYGDDPEALIADRRYGFISGACQEAVITSPERRYDISEQIDRVVTNRWLGLPLFLLLMFAMFAFVFTLGSVGTAFIERGLHGLSSVVETALPDGWLASLLVDGVITGVGNVLVFLPLVVLLFLAIAFLEDTGYMARAAFVIDRVMHAIGLHGRSFIPMVLGFGCSVPAVMATRTLASRRDRLTTMFVVPFMSCGARLPIYMLLTGAFFAPKWRAWVVFSLYVLGVVVAGIVARVLRRVVFPGPSEPFVMELPPYRMPTVRGVLMHMWRRAWEFLKRAGSVVLLLSIIMWVLQTFPLRRTLPKDYPAEIAAAEAEPEVVEALRLEQAAEWGKRSLAGRLGTWLAPTLRPLGLGNWKISTALLSGFFAKEAVISTLAEAYTTDDGGTEATLSEVIERDPMFTPLKAYALMVFVLLYVPCMATVAVVGRESGSWKWSVFLAVYTTGLAYLLAVLVYQGGRLLGLG